MFLTFLNKTKEKQTLIQNLKNKIEKFKMPEIKHSHTRTRTRTVWLGCWCLCVVSVCEMAFKKIFPKILELGPGRVPPT